MITSFTLIANKKGAIRAVKRYTSLAPGEVAVNIRLNLPDSLFTKPQLNAEITVPEKSVTPYRIEADVQDNIKQSLETILGGDVKIQVFQQ